MSEHVLAYLDEGSALQQNTLKVDIRLATPAGITIAHRNVLSVIPHTADSLEYLIRPNKDNKLPSKTQISEIKKAIVSARLRFKVAHC